MNNKPTGLGVDAMGGPVIDPTANVIALNEAGHKRQDDIRAVFALYVQSEIKRVEDIANLKADHVKELTTVHQTHDYALHKAEAGRLDALRQNDREDVKALAIATQQRAEVLAASIASTTAEQNKRISSVELAQSVTSGQGAGAKNLWFVIAAIILVLGFLLTLGTALVGVALYVSRTG